MMTDVILYMTSNKRDIILDLQHHESCSTAQEMITRLTEGVKISDLLECLGGADSLEFRFSPCPNLPMNAR
jgi:hypothetical protein